MVWFWNRITATAPRTNTRDQLRVEIAVTATAANRTAVFSSGKTQYSFALPVRTRLVSDKYPVSHSGLG